jgi:elongation factor P
MPAGPAALEWWDAPCRLLPDTNAAVSRQEEIVASIRYSEVRKGMVIIYDNQLCYVVDRELKTPGNLPSKLTLTLKNLKTGFVNTQRIHPEDKVEQAYLDKREMQYLYKDADGFVFMDTESYDQITLNAGMVGDLILYVKEGTNVQVTFHDSKALSIEPPASVELEVVDTEPSLKGATAAAQYKPATLETGLKLSVPPFINIGEKIMVDTGEGKYLSRAK